MKTRPGFVANSSSSSFIIIGTTDEKMIKRIMKKEGIALNEEGYYDESGYGRLETENVSCVCDGHNIYNVGVMDDEVVALLEKHTIPEAKKIVAEQLSKKLKIKIKPEDLKFEYGESGDDW